MAEGLPDRRDEMWVDVATARGRRPRSPSRAAKGRGKTKDKDRDATPTMGGTIDPVSDYDDTIDRSKKADAKGPAKGKGYKGGWRPLLDRLGRVDFSYRGCPQQYLAEGARPGENLRRGDISVRHDDVIRQVLPASEEDALAMASEMSYIRILERGFINHGYGIQGRGRWDGHNQIFRCIVVCQTCNASECNKRMWYQLDNHDSHMCERCLRDHEARSLRR